MGTFFGVFVAYGAPTAQSLRNILKGRVQFPVPQDRLARPHIGSTVRDGHRFRLEVTHERGETHLSGIDAATQNLLATP